jgi:hypothetical protein
MNSEEYEGFIDGFTFFKRGDIIEVWLDLSDDSPEELIQLRDGEIKNKKDFDQEIAYWFFNHKL